MEFKEKKSENKKEKDVNKYELFIVENLSSKVEFLDFSTDNFYLMYKSPDEFVIIDLSNLEKINTVFVEFDIEWCSDGIKTSDKTKVYLKKFKFKL